MTFEFKQTPTTPAWICELASTQERLPPAAWRIMTWLAAELLAHNARTGYTRKRFGHGLAAQVGRCSPRTAQRALSVLASIGLIDRVEEGSQFGALTGIPSLHLKRHSGGASFRGIDRPTPPQPEPAPASLQSNAKPDPIQRAVEPSNADRDNLAAEWASLKSDLRAQIDSESFECYIAPLVILPADGTYLLSAPNDLVQEQAQRILGGAECCRGAVPNVIVGQPTHTSTRSMPYPRTPPVGRQVPQPRRPITEKICRKVVSELQEHFYVMAQRGRRPTEKFEVLYAWIIYHATYGSGSEDPRFTVNQAISGALSLLKAGRFSMPAGFQPELVQRYVDRVKNEIEGSFELDCYDNPGAEVRQACHLVAA